MYLMYFQTCENGYVVLVFGQFQAHFQKTKIKENMEYLEHMGNNLNVIFQQWKKCFRLNRDSLIY